MLAKNREQSPPLTRRKFLQLGGKLTVLGLGSYASGETAKLLKLFSEKQNYQPHAFPEPGWNLTKDTPPLVDVFHPQAHAEYLYDHLPTCNKTANLIRNHFLDRLAPQKPYTVRDYLTYAYEASQSVLQNDFPGKVIPVEEVLNLAIQSLGIFFFSNRLFVLDKHWQKVPHIFPIPSPQGLKPNNTELAHTYSGADRSQHFFSALFFAHQIEYSTTHNLWPKDSYPLLVDLASMFTSRATNGERIAISLGKIYELFSSLRPIQSGQGTSSGFNDPYEGFDERANTFGAVAGSSLAGLASKPETNSNLLFEAFAIIQTNLDK